jgi:hypothetical protein
VPFSYYQRLSARDKKIYQQSDAVTSVRLIAPAGLQPFVTTLREILIKEDRRDIQATADFLTRGLTTMLDVPPVRLEVLAVRPLLRNAELHGLYTRDGKTMPKVQLWMRTAQKRRVVAFRTFLRTLLHELGHHLDYDLLRLPDSFHTEGFFKRESSLFYQLVPEASLEKTDPVTKRGVR